MKKHGLSQSPLYNAYNNMRQRCCNPNNPQYKDYGGRGIKVCDRWLQSFTNFVEDMGQRPPGTTLDRINVHGDYAPSNCRWADRFEQMANRQRNSKVGIGIREVQGGYMVRCRHKYVGYTRDLNEARRMYQRALTKEREMSQNHVKIKRIPSDLREAVKLQASHKLTLADVAIPTPPKQPRTGRKRNYEQPRTS